MGTPYQPRTYRADRGGEDLVAWRITLAETDLHIQAERKLHELSLTAAREARAQVEQEMARQPEFATSLHPLPAREAAPPVVAGMYAAAACAGVGPLAAVAGAIAHYVGEALETESGQVIVENGGDIFLHTACERLVGIVAGRSPFSGKVALVMGPGTRCGVCTSSGILGHSYSMGRADAAVVVAPDAALADATASALGNRVLRPEDAEEAVNWALTVPGVSGALVICGMALAAGGEVALRRL